MTFIKKHRDCDKLFHLPAIVRTPPTTSSSHWSSFTHRSSSKELPSPQRSCQERSKPTGRRRRQKTRKKPNVDEDASTTNQLDGTVVQSCPRSAQQYINPTNLLQE